MREGKMDSLVLHVKKCMQQYKIVKPVQLDILATKRRTAFTRRFSLTDLEDFLWLQVCDSLTVQDAYRLQRVSRHAARVHHRYNIVCRREMICFHSKISFKEDILGIGISATYHGNGVLKSTKLTLDVLSLTAFKQGVRRGVWKEEIHDFLPLVIDPEHGARALPHIEAVIMRLCGNPPTQFENGPKIWSNLPYRPPTSTSIESSLSAKASTEALPFKPAAALKVICVTMNSLVVSIMDQLTDDNAVPPLHASEKALQGYAYMHHILLFLASKHPSVAALADARVNKFLQDKDGTHKKCTPSLGELLPLLCLSQKGWDSCKQTYLRENIARDVRWVLRQISKTDRENNSYYNYNRHSERSTAKKVRRGKRLRLALLTDTLSEKQRDTDLHLWFTATLTGKRLGVFQCFFVNHIGRPGGSRGWLSVLAGHNRALGRLRPGLCLRLQRQCKEVLKKDFGWSGFFRAMGLPVPTKKQFVTQLSKAYATSLGRGYHILGHFEKRIIHRSMPLYNRRRSGYHSGYRDSRDDYDSNRGGYRSIDRR